MIKFGPSGNSKAFYAAGNKHSVQAPAWLKSVGLNAYEYSFGRGITLKSDTAREIGEAAKQNGISLSVHAPYFVNFASVEDQKVENSYGYILRSLDMLNALGGERCIMHTGTCTKLERAEALRLCRERLSELAKRVEDAGLSHLKVCPEAMGKYSQIGTAEEIIDFCTLSDIYVPCLDFGHINCYMQGALKTKADYAKIIEYAFDRLPAEKVKNMHVHFSRIEYSEKGEVKHLDFTDQKFGPDFEPFCEAIEQYDLTPTIICESSEVMAEDAMKMRDIWLAYSSRSVK